MDTYLQAGEIVAAHGVRGEAKLLPWADSPDFLLGFDTLYIGGAPYRVEQARVHKNCVLVKLAGVDTPEQVQALRGKPVMIDRSSVRLEDGRVFIADLIGLKVLADGREIGAVTDVLSLPANDVYVVTGQQEYMIPAVKEFIKEINLPQGYMTVSLLEGMQTHEN